MWWVYAVAAAVVFLAMAVNRLLLPAITGWSLGRALLGIRVVRRDGAAAGAWRLLVRDLAHLLDTAALFIGWLWPLWDSRRRTFADLLLRTEVRRVDRPERDMRRLTAKVLAAAVVVCAAAVALNYLVIYRQERAVDQTRQQIAEQGPRIVEQMLSYNKDTLNDDFARAQSLATDSYRPQLVSQQDGGAEGGCDVKRVLGGQQRSALGVTGQGGDAAGHAGPTWGRPERPAIHHRDGASGLRKVRRRTVAGRQPHRAEEADDERGSASEPAPQDRCRRAGDLHRSRSETPAQMGAARLSRALSALLVAAAIAVSSLMLVSHETDRRTRSPGRGRAQLCAVVHDDLHDAGPVPGQLLR